MELEHPLLDQLVQQTLAYFHSGATTPYHGKQLLITVFDASEIVVAKSLKEDLARAKQLIIELIHSQDRPLVPKVYDGALKLGTINGWTELAQELVSLAIQAVIEDTASPAVQAEDTRRHGQYAIDD